MDQIAVSVILACRNVEQYIGAAIESVQRQSVGAFELIVVDDRSTDNTLRIAHTFAASDSRIRVVSGLGGGPASARNIGLDQARGEWIAILDGDDLMHHGRLEELLACAETAGADLVADELMAFTEDAGQRDAWLFLGEDFPGDRDTITLLDLLCSGKAPNVESRLGYLKPMVRSDFLKASGVTYRQELIIGEDFDFLSRLLKSGGKMSFSRKPLYLYRRHANSVSFRLNVRNAELMVKGSEDFQHEFAMSLSVDEKVKLAQRHARLEMQVKVQKFMAAIKSGRLWSVLNVGVAKPAVVFVAAGFILEGQRNRIRTLFSQKRRAVAPRRHLMVVATKEQDISMARTGVSVPADSIAINVCSWSNRRSDGEALAKVFSNSLNVETIEIAGSLDKNFVSGYIHERPTFSTATDVKPL